ncbi:MAG TPA: hypothetical protein VLS95_16615, partial [Arthrobacter sp.]|nr:hypothetical protein [Arthrobacter sp.]
GDTAVLEGTRVLISDTAAGLLNKTFNTDAVKADMLVGIAKITVNTKYHPSRNSRKRHGPWGSVAFRFGS